MFFAALNVLINRGNTQIFAFYRQRLNHFFKYPCFGFDALQCFSGKFFRRYLGILMSYLVLFFCVPKYSLMLSPFILLEKRLKTSMKL